MIHIFYSVFWFLSVSVSRTYQAVKLLYCFGIFITFALQFYVPAEILIPPVVARVSERWEMAVDLLLRTVLVIFTCEYEPSDEAEPDSLIKIIYLYFSELCCDAVVVFRLRAAVSLWVAASQRQEVTVQALLFQFCIQSSSGSVTVSLLIYVFCFVCFQSVNIKVINVKG